MRDSLERRRGHAIALLLYLLLSLVMTWPLAVNLGEAIPGDGFDGWQNVWNLWWMREAWLVEHSSAYHTDMLHYPTGADLRFQTMAPFNGLVFLNVQTAVGLLPAYNAAVLFSFVAGGYGAYLLALYALRSATGERAARGRHSAAFIAGLIYAFSPYHFAHLLGHLQLIVLQWIPFYALYLLRGLDRAADLSRSGNRPQQLLPGATHLSRSGDRPQRTTDLSWLADGAKAGLFLILVGLCDWYYVMYCLFFTALVLLVRLIQRRLGWQGLKLVAVTGIVFAVALAPLLLPMIRGAGSWAGSSLLRDYAETLNLSADLLAFITPQVFHPLWGDWAAARSAAFTATRSEFTVFAGYTVLFLAGIALLTTRKAGTRRSNRAGPAFPGTGDANRNAGFWLLAAGFFALLALGPVLHIRGRTDLLPGGHQVPLPYALLYQTVPFIKLSRSVSRMDVMVMLGLGMAAAFGLTRLSGWLASRPASSLRRLSPAMPALFALLILFEFLPAPYPISPPDTPAWYEALATDPTPGAVLNLPANWERPGYLLYQTRHGKPLATGYITRDDPQTLRERAPVLSHFRWLGPDIHTVRFDLANQGVQVLHDLLGVRWVVLDRYKMPGGPEREYTETTAAALFENSGQAPLYQDERLTVYQVGEPAQRGPYLILAPGWPPRQVDEAGRPWRALPPGQAGLELVMPTTERVIVEIVAEVPEGGALTLADAGGDSLPLGPCGTQDGPEHSICLSTRPWQLPAGTADLSLKYDGPDHTQAVIYAIATRSQSHETFSVDATAAQSDDRPRGLRQGR